MTSRRFIDCHSHVVPSGDDGARTVAEGVQLCRAAAETGTAVIYATPHVWSDLPLHEARERRLREAAVAMQRQLGDSLELRIGFELTPDRLLLEQDPRRYALEGTSLCLVETPFASGLSVFWALAEHVEAAGLTPLIAHPERSSSFTGGAGRVEELLERGWPIQVTAASLDGRGSVESERLAWRLLEASEEVVVASDGHRAHRPALLDDAWRAVVRRLGEAVAARAFGGAGIGLAPAI